MYLKSECIYVTDIRIVAIVQWSTCNYTLPLKGQYNYKTVILHKSTTTYINISYIPIYFYSLYYALNWLLSPSVPFLPNDCLDQTWGFLLHHNMYQRWSIVNQVGQDQHWLGRYPCLD